MTRDLPGLLEEWVLWTLLTGRFFHCFRTTGV